MEFSRSAEIDQNVINHCVLLFMKQLTQSIKIHFMQNRQRVIKQFELFSNNDIC